MKSFVDGWNRRKWNGRKYPSLNELEQLVDEGWS